MVDSEWSGAAVRVEVDRAEGAAVTVRLTGELDLSGEVTVLGTVAGLLAAGVSEMVIDLAGLTFCDSSGIRILVMSCRDGRAVGVPVRVESAQAPVAEVLRLTGVWSLLTGDPAPGGTVDTDLAGEAASSATS